MVELALDCRNAHGEGATWGSREKRLYWVDIEGRAVWRWDPVTGETRTWPTGRRPCCLAVRGAGGVVVALEDRFAFLDVRSGGLTSLGTVEVALPATRMNDGRCDRQGRFVAGGMNESPGQERVSGVYRLDPDLRVTQVIAGVACTNSICFSPDGRTMYFADTPTRRVLAYAYDADSGTPYEPRVLYEFTGDAGKPDGSTVDADGCLWNAVWNGRRIVRITPDGRLDRSIDVPVTNPTCLAFGGSDLGTLYVTTSRQGLSDAQCAAEPHAGSLFAIRPGPRGLPEPEFAG